MCDVLSHGEISFDLSCLPTLLHLQSLRGGIACPSRRDNLDKRRTTKKKKKIVGKEMKGRCRWVEQWNGTRRKRERRKKRKRERENSGGKIVMRGHVHEDEISMPLIRLLRRRQAREPHLLVTATLSAERCARARLRNLPAIYTGIFPSKSSRIYSEC